MADAITCPMILTGASTRVDGSLNLRFSSPELSANEKATFFELLNKNLRVLIQPIDSPPLALKEVKAEFSRLTPSQRLRNLLFVLHKKQERTQDFDAFYIKYMNDLCESIKAQLAPT